LRYTGCRPSEAANLKWEQIDLAKGIVVIERHKTARTQKQPLPRVIYLHPVAVRLLLHIRARAEGEFVFLNFRKTKWNRYSLANRVQRAREAAGIPDDAKLYGLRHAFGTRAIVNGCDIKTLATLMGHTTTKMTERYIHLAGKNEHLSLALELINRRQKSKEN
jgi:integrase